MSEQSIDHLGLVYLRCDFPDIYRDMAYMVPTILEPFRFRGIPDEYDTLSNEVIAYCQPHLDDSPTCSNRVYVTTEYFHPVLVLANLAPEALSQLISNTFTWGSHVESLSGRGEDVIALWLFEGDRRHPPLYLTPLTLSEMLIAYYPENLLARQHLRRNWLP